jgi:uncharacterized protein (TIGR02145 family)
MKNFMRTSMCLLLIVAGLSCKKNTTTPDPNTVKDIDGNVYKTVKIGNQTWMAENLRTTKYRNGDPIPLITDAGAWSNLSSGAYQGPYFSDKLEYGNFYNWYAVNDPRNIAPEGWHVATDAEFTELASFLGGNTVAGDKLKEAGTTHWNDPNSGTNESGFTALGSGIVNAIDGTKPGAWIKGFFVVWTNTLSPGTSYPILYTLDNDLPNFTKYVSNNILGAGVPKRHGCAVRCVKD